MTLTLAAWERPLLALAHEAQGLHDLTKDVAFDAQLLERAYAHCQQMTSQHSRSFFWASQFLTHRQRQAVRALYAFCRTSDDIVDHPSGDVQAKLAQWHARSIGGRPPADDLVAVAWTDTHTQFQIPNRYVDQLIEGVARDLHQVRYQTFDELATYCYGVASTVGLMSMHIIGFESETAIPYAIKLGVALQLTNILRDVGEDWQRGRFYLPLHELKAFGLSEADIDRGVVNDSWRAFIAYQIERTRQLYDEAWPGLAFLAPEGRFSIAAAAGFYRAILEDIEAHDYDNFNRRAYVSQWRKLSLLPNLWWQMWQHRQPPIHEPTTAVLPHFS